MSEMPSAWDAETIRDLRERLGLTQAELAEQIGTRQQTISEWETANSQPRRMSQRLLHMVAESSRAYDTRLPVAPHPDATPPVRSPAQVSQAPTSQAKELLASESSDMDSAGPNSSDTAR